MTVGNLLINQFFYIFGKKLFEKRFFAFVSTWGIWKSWVKAREEVGAKFRVLYILIVCST
ncbi:uncharacterized protein CELE_C34C6.9 [Caenorhabditis elegans]|uniref:Uncharacterized protein n=1 Tax=Caenorhabditis elegans TaxID=6239 RepID=D3KFS5_CAEEL|nr:Uncharacterized protein CELE_C34C6.9 [Caenorhabditis elegans]CBJ25059.1 Uncharacterized protein CELE_C34C6.9 [Caenorhabditis elegans]|eukprot:NP_001254177.1 Uncharacterized protein CELE_C34C6.9 [Caenorhabditis elegans]